MSRVPVPQAGSQTRSRAMASGSLQSASSARTARAASSVAAAVEV